MVILRNGGTVSYISARGQIQNAEFRSFSVCATRSCSSTKNNSARITRGTCNFLLKKINYFYSPAFKQATGEVASCKFFGTQISGFCY